MYIKQWIDTADDLWRTLARYSHFLDGGASPRGLGIPCARPDGLNHDWVQSYCIPRRTWHRRRGRSTFVSHVILSSSRKLHHICSVLFYTSFYTRLFLKYVIWLASEMPYTLQRGVACAIQEPGSTPHNSSRLKVPQRIPWDGRGDILGVLATFGGLEDRPAPRAPPLDLSARSAVVHSICGRLLCNSGLFVFLSVVLSNHKWRFSTSQTVPRCQDMSLVWQRTVI